MKLALFFGCLLFIKATHSLAIKEVKEVKEDVIDNDWWRSATIYQIYPRSFKDSNDDGIGDLRGILNKIDYFKKTKVDVIWLSPIYKSPQVDAGYDISDFRAINEEYGTMADFEELVTAAKKLGIRIVMDLVPNHSSDKHEWFVKSEARDPEFENYYVWKDAVEVEGVKSVPNNWLSIWKYSAWEWSETRQQYYLHQFSKEQPDLNYAEPKVVAEMIDIMEFWLDKGIAGFRVDAIPHLFETGMEDEPASGNPGVPEHEWEFLKHTLTKDQPETFEMVYTWRTFVDNYSKEKGDYNRILMTEAYTDIKTTMKYYGDGNKIGAHFSFNFQLITEIDNTANAKDIVAAVKSWNDNIPSQYVSNWVIGNHDNHRVATRFGQANADGFNMLVMMLPGVAVTYNGEEIGMENGKVTWEQGKDPSAINGEEEDFEAVSRDFERTPFHWDETVNAGFNEGAEPWLPVSEKHLTNNVKLQEAAKESHLKVYRDMYSIRKAILSTATNTKDTKISAHEDNLLIVRRTAAGEEEDYAIVLLFNVGDKEVNFDLHSYYDDIGEDMQVVLKSVGGPYSVGYDGSTSEIKIGPHHSIILTAEFSSGPIMYLSFIVLAFSMLTHYFV